MEELPNDKKVPARWTLYDHERPWTMNNERTWHWSKRASRTKETRERFAWLCLAEKVPSLEYVSFDIVPLAKHRGSLADPAAHYPTVKAAIDGIVDAGVIPDDSGKYIQKITFWSPLVSKRDGLQIIIKEERKEDDTKRGSN